MAKAKPRIKQSSVNVSLPESLLRKASRRAETGGFGNMSEYVRHAIREDLAAQRELERRLDAAEASPGETLDQSWVDERVRSGRERSRSQRRRAG